jgi:hypothetical protein
MSNNLWPKITREASKTVGADPDHRGGFLAVKCWGDHWNGEMHGYVWFSYAWVKGYMSCAFALEGDGSNGPVITSCNPTNAAVGATVTITGTGFGALRRQAGVTFNGLAATVVGFANESITATVPRGATSGPLIVCDWEGIPSNPISFAVTKQVFMKGSPISVSGQVRKSEAVKQPLY